VLGLGDDTSSVRLPRTYAGRVTRHDPGPEGSAGGGRRIPELDALRGLACVIILVYHFKPHLVLGGWAAVDFFFILSGFLITSIILKYAREPRFLAHFYMRRGLRIWPVYYLTLLLMVLASPWLARPSNFRGLAYVLTYTQNVSLYWSDKTPEFSPYLAHSWSLAVEEQFYLLWPLLVCVMGRRGVVPLAVALGAVSVGARASGYHWWLLLARGDGLALGALLAALLPDGGREDSGPARWARPLLSASGLVSLVYLITLTATGGMSTVNVPRWPALTVLAVNVFGASIVGLVLRHEGGTSLRLLRSRWLVKLGTLSYGLYMYHFVIILLSDDAARALGMGGRPFWREALTAGVIYGLAALSWRYFESPLLRLKDRFAYEPSARAGLEGPHAVSAEVSSENAGVTS
jgi:peptidoglycan/LPS O-acetylase OafA/YrhL